MKLLELLPAKYHLPSRFVNLILVTSSLCIFYLLASIFLLGTSQVMHNNLSDHNIYAPTTLDHIVFGIASNQKSWPSRKEYVKLWWRPNQMRGCVFLESLPADATSYNDSRASLPPICISGDTSTFRYTCRNGLRSAIRVARVVSETVALNHSNVRWYVFGDDDTVFVSENLVKTLSKYDHELWYYIGSNSEIIEQNSYFAFEMAFGGGGFAISSPLAKVLAKSFDSCIERYPHLYGSDSRIYSCLAELGVGLTREPGFHQTDVRGDLFGFLTSHPISPLVSLHHFDHLDPIFPNMTSVGSLEHLLKAVDVDPERILQKTVCYDRWFSWTISVSWGYAVEVYGNHVLFPDVLPIQATFKQWKKRNANGGFYSFNTREPHPDPCRRPTVFFLENVTSGGDHHKITSHYKKSYANCSVDVASPRKLEEIKIFSTKLDLSDKQLRAPRRHCCDVLPSPAGKVMEIAIRECKEDELIYMQQDP